MQTALDSDMAVINDDGTKNYVENNDDFIPEEKVVYAEAEVKEVNVKKVPDEDVTGNEENADDISKALFG